MRHVGGPETGPIFSKTGPKFSKPEVKTGPKLRKPQETSVKLVILEVKPSQTAV